MGIKKAGKTDRLEVVLGGGVYGAEGGDDIASLLNLIERDKRGCVRK